MKAIAVILVAVGVLCYDGSAFRALILGADIALAAAIWAMSGKPRTAAERPAR